MTLLSAVPFTAQLLCKSDTAEVYFKNSSEHIVATNFNPTGLHNMCLIPFMSPVLPFEQHFYPVRTRTFPSHKHMIITLAANIYINKT